MAFISGPCLLDLILGLDKIKHLTVKIYVKYKCKINASALPHPQIAKSNHARTGR